MGLKNKTHTIKTNKLEKFLGYCHIETDNTAPVIELRENYSTKCTVSDGMLSNHRIKYSLRLSIPGKRKSCTTYGSERDFIAPVLCDSDIQKIVEAKTRFARRLKKGDFQITPVLDKVVAEYEDRYFLEGNGSPEEREAVHRLRNPTKPNPTEPEQKVPIVEPADSEETKFTNPWDIDIPAYKGAENG
jgi:hypothetical protein